MVFVILLCQQVEAHDHDAQHHQHDTGRAVEGLGVRLIGKDRRLADYSEHTTFAIHEAIAMYEFYLSK